MMGYLAEVIEYKYGLCADTAVYGDGTFSIERWDESIGGPRPSDAQLLQDVQDYINNVLPEKIADSDEQERLHLADIKFKKLTLSALEDINKAQPNLFSQKTKELYQELRALLR